MSGLARTLSSSIGAKVVMAITGVLLLLFVIGHMIGNLQVFLGQDVLNAYAAKLQSLGPLLWVVRLGLLTIFVLHMVAALRVWLSNRAARPVPYQRLDPQVTSFAARTMIVSGVVVLVFVVYHLLHLTVGVTNPEHAKAVQLLADGTERHDVYGMVVKGFQLWPVTVVYVVANILLGLHISHGASSLFQTLGVTHPRLTCCKDCLGPLLGWVIAVGNCSMPLACLVGLVELPA